MKYLLERKEFLENQKMTEGFFSDLAGKVKKFFGGFMGKVGKWFIGVFGKNGLVQAVSPLSTISYVNNMKPNGVHIYTNPSLAKTAEELGAGSVQTTVQSDIFVDKTESEQNWESSDIMKNLRTLVQHLNESVENNGDYLAEKLDDLKAVSSGGAVANVADVNIQEFKDTIYEILDTINDDNLNADEKEYKVPVIFGAPGIGKTQIIKSIVDIINKNCLTDKDKMSFIHVNCATLNPGELFMPTVPKAVELTDYVKRYQSFFDDESKTYADDAENAKHLDSKQMKFTSAVASWLPVYDTTGDYQEQKIGNTVANMGSYVDKKTGFSVTTGGGGILFFDEVLRSKPAVFSELMTFLQDGRFNNWKLGSKWIMVCASNRPSDDIECEEAFASEFGAAKRDRFAPMNYVPDTESWINWATKNNINKYIIKYIKTYPDMFYEPAEDATEEFAIGANPRNWTLLSKAFAAKLRPSKFAKYDEDMKVKEVKSIKSMNPHDLNTICSKYLGRKLSDKFTTWLRGLSDEEIDVEQIFKDPDNVDVILDKNSISNSLLNNITTQVIERNNKQQISSEEMSNLFKYLTVNMGLDPKTQRNIVSNLINTLWEDNVLTDDTFGYDVKITDDNYEWTPKEKYRDALAYSVAYIPRKKDPIFWSSKHDAKSGKTLKVFTKDQEFVELVGNYLEKYFSFNIDSDGDIIFYTDTSDRKKKVSLS